MRKRRSLTNVSMANQLLVVTGRGIIVRVTEKVVLIEMNFCRSDERHRGKRYCRDKLKNGWKTESLVHNINYSTCAVNTDKAAIMYSTASS